MGRIRDLVTHIWGRSAATNSHAGIEHIVRKSAREQRRRLRKIWLKGGLPNKERAARERAVRKIARKRIRALKQGSHRLSLADNLLLLQRLRPSKLLDRLFPDRRKEGVWLDLRSRRPNVSAMPIQLERFSFLDDPEGTLAGLRTIAEAESRSAIARIDFCDEHCLDVVPFMLLAECWSEMLPVFEGGRMNIPMQKVLAAVGVQHAMGIGLGGVTEFSDVWTFPLYRRRREGATSSRTPFLDVQTREIATDHFCAALDEWLAQLDISLNSRGVAWIKQILGELLENAERHSDGERGDGPWAVSGFMARREEGEDKEVIFRAHIGIVNLGDTFSESLMRATPDVRKGLDAYVASMRESGAVQSAATLRTLAALQDGITCDPDADNDDRGGYGLQEMLDLVSLLGHTTDAVRLPRITIVSGSSCIRLRHPYLKGTRMEGAASPRVLWCNSTNSRDAPPDPAFVFDLEPGLPGTAISIGFVLDPSYFHSIARERDNNGDDRSSSLN